MPLLMHRGVHISLEHWPMSSGQLKVSCTLCALATLKLHSCMRCCAASCDATLTVVCVKTFGIH